jgi:hypothetical protein
MSSKRRVLRLIFCLTSWDLTSDHHQSTAGRGPHPAAIWVLCIINAGLLVTSGLIHLHRWDIAYRHVKTLGPLFLVQVIAALLMAVALLVTHARAGA